MVIWGTIPIHERGKLSLTNVIEDIVHQMYLFQHAVKLLHGSQHQRSTVVSLLQVINHIMKTFCSIIIIN